MDFVCYLNLIEQQMYQLQRFQQKIWQPWRDAQYLGKLCVEIDFMDIELD